MDRLNKKNYLSDNTNSDENANKNRHRNGDRNRFKKFGRSFPNDGSHSRGNSGRYSKSSNASDDFEYVNSLNLIDYNNDIKCTPDVEENICEDFSHMNIENGGLKEEILQGIGSTGFTAPSPIQKLMIQPILNGKNIIAQAQSGTGKTGGFMISSLQLIDETIKAPQVIIVSPTSELAFQTMNFGKKITRNMDVRFSYTVGKTNKEKNSDEITGNNEKGIEPCEMIIGTPGRILDMIKSHGDCFGEIKMVVLDECDSLLTGSFQTELYNIFEKLRGCANKMFQVCLVSATFRKEVYELGMSLLNEPSIILLKQEKLTLDGIKQRYVSVPKASEKKEMLKNMLSVVNIAQLIIYVNKIETALEVQEYLLKNDHFDEDDIKIINSSLDRSERISILNNFERGNGKCLISTDLLARGINIQQLSLVINYELPSENNLETYVHRIGRTGRFGREGLSINLIEPREKIIQEKIQTDFKCEIKALTPDELTK